VTSLAAAYRQRLKRGELAADAAQEHAVAALDRLHRDLVRAPPHRGWRKTLAQLARQRRAPVKGLYLWGSVGRGKTFLMDLFFNALPFKDKTRQHFHRFMADVHERLTHYRDVESPLDLVAEEIAGDTRIICFDEFVVSDIADAMLLSGLFSALFARGVALAATSNIAPEDLYKGGLQRQGFLPTIALLREHTEVLHIDDGLDYRLRALERAGREYHDEVDGQPTPVDPPQVGDGGRDLAAQDVDGERVADLEPEAARHLGAFVEPLELAENHAFLGLRNAEPGVVNVDAQLAARTAAADQHTALRRVLHRVVEQVFQHALDQRDIGIDEWQVG